MDGDGNSRIGGDVRQQLDLYLNGSYLALPATAFLLLAFDISIQIVILL